MDIRKFFVILIVGLLGILLQGTFLRTLFPVGYIPNFLIAGLVFLALVEVSVAGVFLAALLGLLLDLFSSQFIGPWIGAFVAVFAVYSAVAQRLYVGSVIFFSLVVTLASFMAGLVYIFMVLPYSEISQTALPIVVYESLLSGLVAPLVFYVLKRFYPDSSGHRSLFRHAM